MKKDCFDKIYNDTYVKFLDAIMNIKMPKSFPYQFKDMEELGKYDCDNQKLSFNNSLLSSDKSSIVSCIYHELTHIYDFYVMLDLRYQREEIKILMSTFSEIHASYNGVFALLGFTDLKVNTGYKLTDKVRIGNTLASIIEILNVSQKYFLYNPCDLTKKVMYYLGQLKAFNEIIDETDDIIKKYFTDSFIPDDIKMTSYEALNKIDLLNIENNDCISLSNLEICIQKYSMKGNMMDLLKKTPSNISKELTETIKKIIDTI